MSDSHERPLPCRHLRNKEMYYEGSQPEDEQFCSHLDWCARTHESFGPDNQPVSKAECRPTRACFDDGLPRPSPENESERKAIV